MLIVNFEHAYGHIELCGTGCVLKLLLNSDEDFFACSGHDSFVWAISYDRVALARSCLAIREQACVVALEGIIDDIKTLYNCLRKSYHILKNLPLVSVGRTRTVFYVFSIWLFLGSIGFLVLVTLNVTNRNNRMQTSDLYRFPS